MKRNLAQVTFRLLVIAALITSILGFCVPVMAIASVTEGRDPDLSGYVLNDGSGTELFWWTVTFDNGTNPYYLRHVVNDPLGATVLEEGWLVNTKTSPFYNPNDPLGAHQNDATQPSFAQSWTPPAGSRPGIYHSIVYFYSTQSLGGSYIPTTPEELQLIDGSADQTFWVRQTWQLFKYNDLNGNASFDNATESGLDNWSFTVTGPVGSTPFPGPSNSFSGMTSGGGYLTLPDVAVAGNYTITETLLSGWRNTDPGNPLHQKIVTLPIPAGSGDYDPTVYFGNQELGNLDIFKFNDLNDNGTYEPGSGEYGMGTWYFTITGPGGYSDNGTTASSGINLGKVIKTGLVPGSYTVVETPKSGWTPTTATTQILNVVAGSTTHFIFGNHSPTGNLQVFKYNDLNHNGVYEPGLGDYALSNWAYTIIGTAYSDSGVTDANGLINRVGLVPGTYLVTETVKTDWIVTTSNPQSRAVTADNTTLYEFGNYYNPPNVPASSGWSLWLLIGGLASTMAVFMLWRTRRAAR
jgi:hypothetical protein